MRIYEFTLKYSLGDPHADSEACVKQLQDEGCDDALIGLGKAGRIALQFAREADSAQDAILGGMQGVRRAIPDARFTEAAPDFVGVTDIAELLGFSRQYMAKILASYGAQFPQPLYDGKRPIWHLQPVLHWFATENGREIDPALQEVAEVTMSCNHLNASKNVPQDLCEELRAVLG